MQSVVARTVESSTLQLRASLCPPRAKVGSDKPMSAVASTADRNHMAHPRLSRCPYLNSADLRVAARQQLPAVKSEGAHKGSQFGPVGACSPDPLKKRSGGHGRKH